MKNRLLKVKFNGEISDAFSVNYGVAQGSCLGPLCYIILTNDIVKQLTYLQAILFADDMTLIGYWKNLTFLKRKIMQDLEKLQQWFDANKLTLNVSKTQFMVFGKKDNASITLTEII